MAVFMAGASDLLTPAGHYRSGEHIVRKAVGQLSDHVCTGWCDHHNICLLGNGYMLYLELKVPVKGIHQAFIPVSVSNGSD